MSIKLMSEVWELKLPLAHRHVLLCLADHANDDGTCWPSIPKVAKKAQFSVRWTRQVIKELQEAGHIEIERFLGKGNIYRLKMAQTRDVQFTREDSSPVNPRSPHPGSTDAQSGRSYIVVESSRNTRVEDRLAKGSPTTRGTRLQKDWKPTPELEAWVAKERPDLNLEKTLEAFIDYWTSTAGGKGVKLDWAATFRNWVRNEKRERSNAAKPEEDRWWLSNEGIDRKGRELGEWARPGESYSAYADRLRTISRRVQ